MTTGFAWQTPAVGPGHAPGPVDEVSDGGLLERFIARQDADAFEALVRRHGPMVLRVCRRILRDEHAAEDAFQATFLVLARKAPSIAKPGLLANWLYGVAVRAACKTRGKAIRRRLLESRATGPHTEDPFQEIVERDMRSVLAAALASLPEAYRAPLVLCYLEGITQREAAGRLRCPIGSMSWRLARGREMLRRRLTDWGGQASDN